MNSNEERVVRYSLLLIVAGIFFSIFYYRPYWGLMDDIYNTSVIVPKLYEHGVANFFQYCWYYGISDFSWGMFRPTYPIIVGIIYPPGMFIEPWVSYVWNAFLVICILYFYARVMGKILKIPHHIILLVCAAFFYAHDLFQHLSLQEKLLLFTSALFVNHLWDRKKYSFVTFWAIALTICFLGICVKASFAIHFSLAYVVFVAAIWGDLKNKKKAAWGEAIFLAIIGISMVAFFAFISKHGSYTQQYSYSKVLPNLRSPHGVLFLLPLLVFMVHSVFHWKVIWKNPEKLTAAVGVAAFLALFLPWGIQGYIHTVIAPVYAALLVQIGFDWKKYIPLKWWLYPLCFMAMGITSYRMVGMFSRLHDVGKIVSTSTALANQGVREIYMPCEEGHSAMQYLFEKSGETRIKFHMLNDINTLDGRVVLRDSSMCPLPNRMELPKNCREDILVPGSISRSYRVSKVYCN